MRIEVDPNTDAGGFGYAAPGRYTLRVVSCEQLAGPKAEYLKWKLEFADPNVQAVPGEGGTQKKVGNIFEHTTLKSGDNAQFRLRQLCDALGIPWGCFDTDESIGQTFDAEVDIQEYQGNFSNKVKKYYVKA